MFRLNILVSMFLSMVTGPYAQKPVLDSIAVNHWSQVIRNPIISADGKYVWYAVSGPERGIQTDIVQFIGGSWKKTFSTPFRGKFTSDSRSLIFEHADSVGILRLGNDQIIWISTRASFQDILSASNHEWLAYRVKENDKTQLIIRDLSSGKENNYGAVSDFSFCALDGSLLLYRYNENDSNSLSTIEQLYLKNGDKKRIWEGHHLLQTVYDAKTDRLAFIGSADTGKVNALYYYKSGMKKARELIRDGDNRISTNLVINFDGRKRPAFGSKTNKIYFSLVEKQHIHNISDIQQKEPVKMNVWDYREVELHDVNRREPGPQNYLAVVSVQDKKVVQLEDDEFKVSGNYSLCENMVMVKEGPPSTDFWWCDSARQSVYVVSTNSGYKSLLINRPSYWAFDPPFNWQISPSETYIIRYDPVLKDYFSRNVTTGREINLTENMSVLWEDHSSNSEADPQNAASAGIVAWLKNDEAFIAYDTYYDLWLIDPSNQKKPECITEGYAKTNHIRFKMPPIPSEERLILQKDEKLILYAFNSQTKRSGFYSFTLNGHQPPVKLSMDPYHYSEPLKATRANAWIVIRESATTSPNLFYTTDLRTFQAISDIHPENKYNWLTTQLMEWRLPDGQTCQGVLYKPENFDSTKQYPVIFNYYDQRTDHMHEYKRPGVSNGNINFPWFVSHGYLVFEPDIHFGTDTVPGKYALDAVETAAEYLSTFPWVNKNKIGIQGHSFGGGMTNYIVTHSHRFAAAAEAAGPTDAISSYGGLLQFGGNRQWLFEMSQERIRASLWERPDLYIASSSIFKADQVTTPLLMMHNKNDNAVPWTQGLEFFNALRRMGKRVWMLVYDDKGHELRGVQSNDYTKRLEQFFDHYLKDAPAPKWMTTGIPIKDKGLYYGYELDSTGKEPQEQNVLFEGKMQNVNEALKNKSSGVQHN